MTIEYRLTIVITTPYNVTNNDEVIMVDIPGPASVILPAIGNNDNKKRALYIKDYSGQAKTNPITITSAGGKTIDGVSFAILNGGYSHIQVIYDGTNWKTIG
jgi:hypothetical protein